MIHDQFLETAHAYRVLSGLEPEHLKKLLPLAMDARFDTGEIIFREGGKSMNLYLLVAGDVALENIEPGGVNGKIKVTNNVVQTLRAGDAMGWSALMPGSLTHFQARALTPVTAVAFPGDRLREACDRDPAIGYALLAKLLEVVTERLDATRIQLAGAHAASPPAAR